MPQRKPHRKILVSQPDRRIHAFQDPSLRALAETLPTDHPAFATTICELRLLIDVYHVELTPEIARKVAQRALDRFHRPLPERRVYLEVKGSVVYYMRIGNRVKIGYSANLKSRLDSINPEELMAIEPGGMGLERDRHDQFRELHTHGEWFRLEDPLVSHIDQVRATHVEYVYDRSRSGLSLRS
jgi:hypothetical protein